MIVKRPPGPEANPYSFEASTKRGSGVVSVRIVVEPGSDILLTADAARKMAFILNCTAGVADNTVLYQAPDLSYYVVCDEAAESKAA
jgi:hypothetical protein